MDIKLAIFLLVLLIFSIANANANQLNLKSNDFTAEGILPVLYSCDGKGTSPQLSWDNAPAKTQSYVIVAKEKNSRPQNYLWVLYNIPKNINKIEENQPLPRQIRVAKSYTPPCPVKGGMAYYSFTIYALSGTLNVTTQTQPEDILNSMQKMILEEAEINIPYPRWK